MIGYFDHGGGRIVLNDQGVWEADKPVVADALNETFGPDSGGIGDHHRPYGVARLCRAADAFGAEPHVTVKPYPPLPDGVVS